MKRQLLACVAVLVILSGLYSWERLAAGAFRVYSELAPGGFRVAYYEGVGFDRKIVRRGERHAVRDYGGRRPARGAPSDRYSVRWEGWLLVPETASYVFFMQSQGGSRLWIDDTLIMDKWDDHAWTPGMHGRALLEAGPARVVIEHYKRTGPGAIRLRWAGGPIPANTVMGVPHVRKRLGE